MGTTLVELLGGIKTIVGILAGLLCGVITIFLFPLHVYKYTPSFMGILAFLFAIFAFILPILILFNLILAMGFTFVSFGYSRQFFSAEHLNSHG